MRNPNRFPDILPRFDVHSEELSGVSSRFSDAGHYTPSIRNRISSPEIFRAICIVTEIHAQLLKEKITCLVADPEHSQFSSQILNDFLERFGEIRKKVARAPTISETEILHFVRPENHKEQQCAGRLHQEIKQLFSKFNNLYMQAIEYRFVLNFRSKIDIHEQKHVSDRIMAKLNELSLFQFEKSEHICIVGCGPFSDTAFALFSEMRKHKLKNIRSVTGIDIDPKAVRQAKTNDVYFNTKLERKIFRSFLGEALTFDYSCFDTVYVVGLIPNKDEVVERILSTARRKVQVLVDSPLGLLTYAADPLTVAYQQKLVKRGVLLKKQEVKTRFYQQEMIYISTDIPG